MRLIILILCATPVVAPRIAYAQWRDVLPGEAVVLPRDLFFQKDYRVQWWYFTGHVTNASGREFGYELTFFAAGVQQKPYKSRFGVNFIYLSHFAVSDIKENRFYHFSSADSGAYGFSGSASDRLRVWVDNAKLEGSAQSMHISAQAEDFEIALELVPQKPAVLHGDRGYSRKSADSPLMASRYYSFTDLRTAGMLAIKGDRFDVTGRSWFDREIFSQGAGMERGWDWFSVKLDDGREIMLYQLRNKDGSLDPFSSGTLISRDGEARHLLAGDFFVEILDHYTSRHTGARYPSQWEVAIPSENVKLIIIPLIQDQEFTEGNAIRKIYWEGACKVEGSHRGRAYVELTGYD